MISAHDLERAIYIIDTSNVVDILIKGYRTNPRGRPANRAALRLMLIGLLLAVMRTGKGTLTTAFRLLTRSLRLDAQINLGIVELVDGQRRELVSIEDFYNLEKALCRRLAYTSTSAPDLQPHEREHRHQAMQAYCDALMDVFHIAPTSSTLAIDATGVWSWCRRYSKKGVDEAASVDSASADHVEYSLEDTDDLQADLATDTDEDDKRRPRRRDLDAGHGVKTSKSGQPERFFGYNENTLVQVADDSDHSDAVPNLVVRFELIPADHDVVDVTLRLLDRHPTSLTDVVVDRHYHYKQLERWKRQLIQRDIHQHLDLRADEHGFTESDALRWAAGDPHCPATPDALGTIHKPAAGDTDSAKWATFRKRIALRSAYAMARHNRPDENGTRRYMCPALAGKVGCPLRPATVLAAQQCGLPLVETPPSAETGEPLPKCCTQQTVKITPPPSQLKLMQPHTWGSAEWQRMWNRRTYVEGSYGNRKNTSTENLRRGQFQIFGLVWAHIVMGLVNASYNLRMLDNWCDRHPDHGMDDHPLIAPNTTDTVGHLDLTAEEYDEIMQRREAQRTQAA